MYGERRSRLIFGALSDKDPSALLNELLPLAASVVLVPVPSPRSAKPADLAAVIAAASPPASGCKPVVHIAVSLREALVDNSDTLLAPVGTPECPVLLAGSLFLVGEALALLSGGEATLRSQ